MRSMMIQLKNNLTISDFEGFTAIIPSICVGNAAQLACDLLISSKSIGRVGSFNHPAFIPVHGPSAYQHEPQEKAAACELYSCPEDKLLVFQFRAPLISRHVVDFHKELATVVKKCSRVIILSGSFGFEKRVIESSPYEYKASDHFKEKYSDQLKAVQWKEFEGETIFGGGNALQLFNVLSELQLPVIVLFRYLLEGDNSTDASFILKELNEMCESLLDLKMDNSGMQLKVPISWKLLFGNEGPELMF